MFEVFLNYILKEKRLSDHTFLAYKKDLEQLHNFLVQEFEIANPEKAHHVHLRSWVFSLSEENMSTSSINRKIAAVKSFYKYLLSREILEHNPAKKLKSLKTPKRLPSFVKENEMTSLFSQLKFADDFEGVRDRLLLELLYATGIRLSELIGIKESDINKFDASIKVLGKRNKERIIPLGKVQINLLPVYLSLKRREGFASGSLLVTDKGEKLYPLFVYRKVKQYLSLVTNLSKKSPHVLRHTFATHLLDRGADINAIKELLGHSSLAATQVYTHNSIEKLKNAFKQAHPRA